MTSDQQTIDLLLYQWNVTAGFIPTPAGATVHTLRGRQSLLVGQMKDAAAWERYINEEGDPGMREKLASIATFKRMAATALCKIHRLE